MILVISHKDVLQKCGGNPDILMEQLSEVIGDKSVKFKCESFFLLDCRQLRSKGLSSLLTQLNTTCKILRETANVDLHCHVLRAFLTSKFNNVACQISEIMDAISEGTDILLPQDQVQLSRLLSTLTDQGRVLLLKYNSDENKSWVVLKPDVLLREVNGSIFCPRYFKEQSHRFSMSTGVVALSTIKEEFSYDHNLIIGYLIRLEFCFSIKDQHTLDMVSRDQALLLNQEQYFFFPAFVQAENPADVCKSLDTITYQCGWFYKCCKEAEQLSTRFLHVLILRLAFTCEPPDDPTERESVVLLRSCSVWKHGIAWWTDDGIETIVEVGLQCRWVTVMMRCPDTHKVQCAELRSKAIAIVLKAKQDFCPAFTMNEFLIAPSSLQYPFEGRELTLYSMRKIASIVIEGRDFVKDIEGKNPLYICKLLPFEPYYKMKDLIGYFFNAERQTSSEISSEYLEQIAKKCYENLEAFKRALQPDPITYEEECSRVGESEVKKCVALFNTLKNSQKRVMKTWRDFEQEFSRFSLFCGRNPMVGLKRSFSITGGGISNSLIF